MAQAGHAMNHTSCAGSPQAQVRVDEGWPDHTCHHSTTAGRLKRAMAPRWKPTARAARPVRLRRPGAADDSSSSSSSGSAASSGIGLRRTVPGRVERVDRGVQSTRRSHSSLPPSVLPDPSRTRDSGAPVRCGLPMIVAVPDHRRCIVVGGGLLGLCAARALAQRGLARPRPRGRRRGGPRAVGLQGRRPHLPPRLPRPASTSRWRSAPGDLWLALEAAAGRPLLHPTGQMTFGDGDALGAIAAALAASGAPAEWLSPADASARGGGIAAGGPVLFEPASGVLAADACLRALCETGRLRAPHRCRRARAVRPTRRRHRHDRGRAGPRRGHRRRLRRRRGRLALLDDDAATHRVAAAPSLPQVAYFAPAAGAGPRARCRSSSSGGTT